MLNLKGPQYLTTLFCFIAIFWKTYAQWTVLNNLTLH